MSENVTACIDGSPATAAVCDLAAWAAGQMRRPLAFAAIAAGEEASLAGAGFGDEAQRLQQQSTLHALAAIEQRRRELVMTYGVQLLEAARAYVGSAVPVIGGEAPLVGSLSTTLANTSEAQFLVLGRQHFGDGNDTPATELALGRYLSLLRGPALVVDADWRRRPRHMTVAFDARLTGRRMVEKLSRLPLCENMRVSIVSVGAPSAATREQTAWAHALLSGSAVEIQTYVLPGVAWRVLAEFVERNESDLLVLGSYHYQHLRHEIMGSTIVNLFRSAHVPTLVIQ